jgi:hypothetical protein
LTLTSFYLLHYAIYFNCSQRKNKALEKVNPTTPIYIVTYGLKNHQALACGSFNISFLREITHIHESG